MKRIVAGLLFAAFAAAPAWAQKEVTIGYQDMVVPYRIAQEAKEIEKATGYKVNWKQFGGGGEVIKAMASGAVQIGEVGSAGIAAAVSRGEPLELFWILDDIGVGRGAGREERLRHQHGRRPEGQEDRDAVQLDDALPHDGGARAGQGESGRRADPQHAPARSARRMAARRHPGDVHLGSGAGRSEEGRQGDHHLRQDLGGDRQGDVRRLRRQQGLGEGEPRLHGEVREDHGRVRRQLPEEHREVDQGLRRGEGRREVVGRQARGRARRHGAVQVPDRRRTRRRSGWAAANGTAAKALRRPRSSSSRRSRSRRRCPTTRSRSTRATRRKPRNSVVASRRDATTRRVGASATPAFDAPFSCRRTQAFA